MTEILASFALILTAALALAFMPPIAGLVRGKAHRYQQSIFKLLVGVLYAFSLNETIRETGLIYGVMFSLIPLAAGAVVLRKMKLSASLER